MLKPLKEFLVSREQAGSLAHHLDCGVDRLCQGLRSLGDFGERSLVVISRHFIKYVAMYASDGVDNLLQPSRDDARRALGLHLSTDALEQVIRANVYAAVPTQKMGVAHSLMYAVFQAAGGTIDCVPATVQSVVENHPVNLEDAAFRKRLEEWFGTQEARDFAWGYEPAIEAHVENFKESEAGQIWRLEKVGVDEVTREVSEKIIAKAVEDEWGCVMTHLENWKESHCGQTWLREGLDDRVKEEIVQEAVDDWDHGIEGHFENHLEAWKCDEGEDYAREMVAEDPGEYKDIVFEHVPDSQIFKALGESMGWC